MEKIYLSNTLSGYSEEFVPIHKDFVLMYNCGPTVYSRAHIGNLRAYVFADTLRRTLTVAGYKVKQVINITDVGHLTDDADDGEDKIEKAAKKQHKSAKEISEFYTNLFLKDLQKLNIDTSKIIFPKATEFIDAQIELIKLLEERGYTYKTNDGIYFDTSKFTDYGKLGKLNLENIQEGARIGKNTQKKNPYDFALWKFSNPSGIRQQEWDSPWGIGFPGWHIECSSMIWKLLGEHIDIHTGGIEHIPVHHNNEIAQSESVFGSPLAKYWLHIHHLVVDGKKMSKSKGNIYSLDDLEKMEFSPQDYRYFILTAHYSKPINFTNQSIQAAKNALEKLRHHFQTENHIKAQESKYTEKIKQALFDDLNTAEALSVLFDLTKEKDEFIRLSSAKFAEEILGIQLLSPFECIKIDTLSENIKQIILDRQQARQSKDFKLADRLRDKLKQNGYIIQDNPDGSICIKKSN